MIHLLFLGAAIAVSAMAVSFRLVSFELGLVVGLAMFAFLETGRFVVVGWSAAILERSGKIRDKHRDAEKKRAERLNKMRTEAEAERAKHEKKQGLFRNAAELRLEFETRAVLCASKIGSLAFPIREPERHKKDILDTFVAGINWTIAETRKAVAVRLAEMEREGKTLPQDLSSFFAGAWLALLCKRFATPPGVKSTSEMYGDKMAALSKDGVSSKWISEALTSAIDDVDAVELSNVRVPSDVLPKDAFPRWADETEGDVAFPFAFAAFMIVRGLFDEGDGFDTAGRAKMMKTLSMPSPALPVTEDLTETEAWTFSHEFLHCLTERVRKTFGAVDRAVTHILWHFNSSGGGGRMYDRFLSPTLRESPMFIVLASGMNPVHMLLGDARRTMRQGDYDKERLDRWTDISGVRSHGDKTAWGCLEFIKANRTLLDACRAAAPENPLSQPDRASVEELERITVPAEPLIWEKYDRNDPEPAELLGEERDAHGYLRDGGGPRSGYQRPLICDAAKVNTWYMRNWIGWAITEVERPVRTSRVETEDFQADVADIFETLMETASRPLDIERSFQDVVEKFGASFGNKGAFERLRTLLETAVKKAAYKNPAYDKYCDIMSREVDKFMVLNYGDDDMD